MKFIIASMIVGGLTVVQGGLNRLISDKYGLSTVVFASNILITIIAALIWTFSPRTQSFQWQWWYVIPSLCGLGIVFGIPWAISEIGALRVFLCIVVGQMLLSLLWDYQVEHIAVTPYRLIGALLAVLGLLVSSKA